MAVRFSVQHPQAAAAGQQARRANVDAVLDAVTKRQRHEPLLAAARLGVGGKTCGNVAHRVGVAKVIAHELLDRQQTARRLIAAQLGDAELLGPIEGVGRVPGVEVQLVPQPQQELGRLANRRHVFFLQLAQGLQLAEIGSSVSNQPEPADQLDVAQAAPRALHIRLQEEDGFAVAQPLLPAVLLDSRHEPTRAAMRLPQEPILVAGEERFGASHQAGFDQRRADHRFVARHVAGLFGRPHAMADD